MDNNFETQNDPNQTLFNKPAKITIKGIVKFFVTPKGRISRTQFWLVIFIPFFIYGLTTDPSFAPTTYNWFQQFYYFFLILLSIFISISYFFVGTKRLHDFSQSGWFILVTFIPIANFFLLLFMLFKKGGKEVNKYGHPPKFNLKYFEKNKKVSLILFLLYFLFMFISVYAMDIA
jgi:uncharacterized membrane protein YhaH (DUF805 family)